MRSPLGTLVGRIVTPRPTNTAPVPYTGRAATMAAALGWGHLSGAEQQMRAMGSVGTLFAIVSRLSNSTAQVCWKLYRPSPSGDPEDRREVTSHAALDLWNTPNKFTTRHLLVEATQQHLDLTGEAWWIIGRNPAATIPLELWPVRPDRMTPVPDPEQFLKGYVYTSPDGEKIPLGLDQVIQLKMPNPLDPYRGMGPVQAILTDLDASRYTAEWNRNFFVNGAEPGGIIQVPDSLEDDEFDEMMLRWQESHRGVMNAHRVAIIENGGTWVSPSYSQRDMQFAELRQVSRDTILEAFGMPKGELGIVEDVNRANAETGSEVFADRLIIPRLERIRQALNTQLLPLFGTAARGLEFDYDDPSPADSAGEDQSLLVRSQAAQILINSGFDRAEVLAACELPEIAVAATPEPPPAPEPAPPAEAEPAPPAAPAPAARLQLLAADTTPGGEDLPDVAPVQASWERALAALLQQWGGVVAAQIKALVDKIRALLQSGDVKGLSQLEAPTADADRVLHAALVALATEAAQQVVDEAAAQHVTITAGTITPAVLADVAAVTSGLLAAELATSAGREALRVWHPGVPVGDVVDQVTRHLQDLTDARARLSLGGALTSAQHEGRGATFAAAEQQHGGNDGNNGTGLDENGRALPSVAYYGQEVLDSNTCTFCREIDGRWLGNTYSAALRDYPSGGYTRCLGGVRCRGMVVAVWRGGADQKGWLEKEPPP